MSHAPVTTGLGWLDGSASTPLPDRVREVVESRFGRGFELPPVGYYSTRLGFDGGRVNVHWNGRANALGTTRAEFSQTALDGLGLVGSVGLMRDLADVGYRPSRVDLYVDDHERRMTPGKVRRAVMAGQAVTHARPGRFWRDDESGRETYYLGRGQSERLARCYDRPDDGPVRFELQARKHAARHAAEVVLNAASDRLAEAVMSNVVSFVDFRESKRRDRNGNRVARLAWWADVIGDTDRAAPAPGVPRPSLEELEEHFRHQWSRRLAEFYQAFGPDWLNDVLREGYDRLGDIDERQEEVA